MADVLDIDNAEEFEVDEEGDRKYMLEWLRLYGSRWYGSQLKDCAV
jgi:hypothetical protein